MKLRIRLLTRIAKKLVFSVSTITLLYACGGGGGVGDSAAPSQGSGSSSSTVNITYSKGPVSGATAVLLDENGNKLAGPVTTKDGQASFTDVAYAGLAYARFSGGTYVDEATGTGVTLPSTFVIRSGVVSITSGSTLQLTATPLTEIAFQRADKAAGGAAVLSSVDSYMSQVADEYGLDNINLAKTAPTPLQQISGSSVSDQYGVVLAAVTQQQLNGGMVPGSDALSGYISANVAGVNKSAFNAALVDLQSNTNTSSFVSGDVVSVIASKTGETTGTSLDSDGDGVPDVSDFFPYDAARSAKTDIYLDELTGLNGFTFAGIKPNEVGGTGETGRSVDMAGDINGDGITDLIIGVPKARPNDLQWAGKTYVIFGKSGGWVSTDSPDDNMATFLDDLNGSNGFVLNGTEAFEVSGQLVKSIGDLNGDGYDDLLVSAYDYNTSNANGGTTINRAYVVFGRSGNWPASFELSSLDGSNGFVIEGMDVARGVGGYEYTGGGDINGDGLPDILVTPAFESGTLGRGIYVIFGSRDGWQRSVSLGSVNGSNGFFINDSYSGFLGPGSGLVGIDISGDYNGDGINDITISGPGMMDLRTGPALLRGFPYAGNGLYIIFGTRSDWPAEVELSSKLNGVDGLVIVGKTEGDGLGAAVSGGDVNNDGIDDIVVSATGAYSSQYTSAEDAILAGGQPDSGEVYVVFGRSSGWPDLMSVADLNGSNGFTIYGEKEGDNTGRAIDARGDVNGDGINDIVIGSPFATPARREPLDPSINVIPNTLPSAGVTHVVFGSDQRRDAEFDLASLDGSNGYSINGIEITDNSGYSISSAGDVNNDGIDDIAIGAPLSSVWLYGEIGNAYVIYGCNYSTHPCIADGSSVAATSPPPSVSSTVSIAYSKGPVTGASAVLIDAAGNTVSGPVVTLNGVASFTGVTYTGLAYARFSGGTYIDEATGASVTLPSSFVIRSGVVNITSGSALQIVATPLTEIAFQRAESAGNTVAALSDMNTYMSQVADEYGLDGIDITTVAPTSLQNITGSSASDKYGIALAAVSQQLLDAGNTTPGSQALSGYIRGTSLSGIDMAAFGAALNNLKTNGNTSSYIAASDILLISNNVGSRNMSMADFGLATEAPSIVTAAIRVTDKVTGVPVTTLTADDYRVLEDGVEMTRLESFKDLKPVGDIPYVFYTVLALDISSSLSLTDIQQVKDTARSMIVDSAGNSKLLPNQRVAIYTFDGAVTQIAAYTSDINILGAAIDNISRGGPSTNLYGAIIAGANSWTDRFSLSNVRYGAMVLVTDGDDTSGVNTEQEAFNAANNKTLYVVPVGSNVNMAALQRIAGGNIFEAANFSELGLRLEEVSNALSNFSDGFYLLYYATPKRVGNHTINVSIYGNTNVSSDASVTGSFNADGFTDVAPETIITGGNEILPGDTITWSVETRWSNDPANYSWSVSDGGSILSLMQAAPGNAVMTLTNTGNLSGYVNVRVTDLNWNVSSNKTVRVYVDTDGDGINNSADTDDDNDGVPDVSDAFPFDPSESMDTDRDGIGNNADTDDDNDGVLDASDAFPLDATETVDTDGDGIGDNADMDDDNDGAPDASDAFPLNAAETTDTDGDGIGNNADTDDDNDGVPDILDALPLDATETVDTDGDGIGNNADNDDDNDGVPDVSDAFPLNAAETTDTDGDGIGNNADTDDDNDGVPDVSDAFPLDATESIDTDGDGVGNNADTDDDNDGVLDVLDAFPLDATETVDTDGDGIGNNADTDDDNDGMEDAFDFYPLDSSKQYRDVFELSNINGRNGFMISAINYLDSGFAVDAAGDINGDGISDIVIGALEATGTEIGGIYSVIFGSNTSWSANIDFSSLNGSNGFIIHASTGAASAYSSPVNGAGDVNGDGFDDLIIGAASANNNTGESYVLYGSSDTWPTSVDMPSINASSGFVLNGVKAGDFSGWAVSDAGDINGDGIGDFVIGAPAASVNALNSGQVYVLFGSSALATVDLASLNGSNGFVLNGVGQYDYNGRAVSSAGDVNGDGIGDLLISSPFAGQNAGRTYVVFGQNANWPASIELSSLDGSNGFVLNGINTEDVSGSSVSDIGDVNGDGISDIIIGASNAVSTSGNRDGQAYVVFGSSATWPASINLSSLNGSNGFKINGTQSKPIGDSVNSIGDFNGDGLSDFIVNGITFFGSSTNWPENVEIASLDGSNGFIINFVNLSSGAYDVNSGAGDINNDGLDDLLIGAKNRGTNGESYVVFGCNYTTHPCKK